MVAIGYREALCSFFLGYETLTVVGEAADRDEAIELAFRLAPPVTIMDVKMPRKSGIEATHLIKRTLPEVHVIGVSTQTDAFLKASMTAAGFSTFVTWPFHHEGLPIGRYRLTRKEAESLREKWISQGNLPCDHISLSLKQTDTGYLMRNLLCTQCGAEIRRNSLQRAEFYGRGRAEVVCLNPLLTERSLLPLF